MEELFADLLARHWRGIHTDGRKLVWDRLTAEFKAALPADLACRVTEDTLPVKLQNEKQAIKEER